MLPINEMECFPTLVKNMSDKSGINICSELFKITVTKLERVVRGGLVWFV